MGLREGDSLRCRAPMDGAAPLLPIRKPILVHIDIIELDAPQLLGQHVRVFAVAARAVDDDRLFLIARVAALSVELVHFAVDIGLPHGERTRAGDVSLLVDRRASRVEEEGALGMQRRDVVAVDLDVGLVRMRFEFFWRLALGDWRLALWRWPARRSLLAARRNGCGRWPACRSLLTARRKGGACRPARRSPLAARRQWGGAKRHLSLARGDGVGHQRADH